MSKIKCPQCGYEFPETKEQIDLFNEQVNKAVKAREEELIKRITSQEQEKALKQINDLNNKITKLNGDLKNKDLEKQLAVEESNKKSNKEIEELKIKLNKAESDHKLEMKTTVTDIRNEYDIKIKERDEEIKRYKDQKISLSVKALGEQLEQYCQTKFNEIRSAAFPNAYFEKDTDLKENNNKGDYIYRDYVGEGDNKQEIISIMFDMKTEKDETKTKHKNVDFLAKLDSDRKAKNCEYAVLLSTLEPESDLYTGITDMSYKYPKMYVVRPQCFISIISILRNAALRNADKVMQLAEYQKQNIDIVHFEGHLTNFKKDFMTNVGRAQDKFNETIKRLDAAIVDLTKMREQLISSGRNLEIANNKVQDITIRRLTKDSPSLKEEFKKIKKED